MGDKDKNENGEDLTTPPPADTDTQPDGQTAAGSGELGGTDAEFADPVTRPDTLGQTSVTNTTKEGEAKSSSVPDNLAAAAKSIGLKKSQILSYNERTRVLVTTEGGKYQLSTKGKAVRHLAGPTPPKADESKLDYVDARTRSPFVGTAAALNASVHEEPTVDLERRRSALQRQMAEVEAQIAARG